MIREINEALVLDAVRSGGVISRSAIVRSTGLSAATVTGIAGRLVGLGLLTEVDELRGTGGRPARLLGLGREAVFAVGVRLSADAVLAVLVDLHGDVVARQDERLAALDVDTAVRTITRAVKGVSKSVGNKVIGIGVAVSGVVDRAGGVVRHSGSLGWEDVGFAAQLGTALDLPVTVDSYANSFANGLLQYGTEFSGRDLVVYSIGVSLGAAVVVAGRIHRGHNGTAGGFAHTRVFAAGAPSRPCHCGSSDCLEAWASRWGMEREAQRNELSWNDVTKATSPVRARIVEAAAGRLALGIAASSKALGPETIVIATTLEADLPELATATIARLQAEYEHEPYPAPAMHHAAADGETLARGVAYEVLDGVFSPFR
ncbi:ROK family protein [Kribbella aluminosa]